MGAGEPGRTANPQDRVALTENGIPVALPAGRAR